MRGTLISVSALFAVSFFVTVVLEWRLVPLLRRYRAGQPILEIGPSWHLSKAGTPTMGGLAFLPAMGIALLLFLLPAVRGSISALPLLAAFAYALLNGAIGMLDDLCKLRKKENQGLSAAQKYLLQLLVAGGFLFVARAFCGVETAVALPFSGQSLELGFFYYPLSLLFLTGTVNALNLTDGVDGLLSATTGVLGFFFLLWGYREGQGEIMAAGALLLGVCLGFLCFNAHPARVFMGDTGSLFLGGTVAAVGVLTAHPLTVLIAGGVFVVEAASVILQVVFFKLSGGKRLFRMAPLHHHFEKLGLGEWQIVALFCASGILLGLLALWGR